MILIAGANRRLDRKMTRHMPIEEFGIVITVKAQNGERKGLFDALEVFNTPRFSFPTTRPVSSNIHIIHGIDKNAHHRVIAVGHGIAFKEAWSGFFPLVAFDGDILFENTTRFGSKKPPLIEACAHWFDKSVNSFWRNTEEFLFDMSQ